MENTFGGGIGQTALGEMLKDRLFEIRTEHGLTRDEASALVGASHASWSNWESGRNVPKAEWIATIADTFDVTTKWLECGLGEKTKGEEEAKKKMLEAKKKDETQIVYNKEDEERLKDIETVIRYIKDMDVPKERKRHIHRTLSTYRTELENIVLFGEIR